MIDASYDVCQRLARQHYENFPVASRLVPKSMRPHIAAVYAFARVADDFADEGNRPVVERLALLDDWEHRLDEAMHGRIARDGSDAAHVFAAVSDTARRFNLDVRHLHDLVSAFRQDVTTTRYETWEDLLDYCRRSANPVGRLVLGIAGYRDGELERSSDALCSALQLANFWQDLAIDWRKGRLYVPMTFVRDAGATEGDLNRERITPEWATALERAAAETRRLFMRGRRVADGVSGRLRWELRATWLGGMRILDRTQAASFDVFRRRPTLGWKDATRLGWQVLTWRGSSREPIPGSEVGRL